MGLQLLAQSVNIFQKPLVVETQALVQRGWRGPPQAATTMARIDLWHAQLALKTLRRDQREAIAEAAEEAGEAAEV